MVFTCFAPRTKGIRHSGSVAWVDSSISTYKKNQRMCKPQHQHKQGKIYHASHVFSLRCNSTWRNLKFANRGSPAPTQVQQITSALWEISLSVARFSALYFFSSLLDNSPVEVRKQQSISTRPVPHHVANSIINLQIRTATTSLLF